MNKLLSFDFFFQLDLIIFNSCLLVVLGVGGGALGLGISFAVGILRKIGILQVYWLIVDGNWLHVLHIIGIAD